MTTRRARLFTDDHKDLDRFGALLVIVALSVAGNSLFDLDNPTEDLGSEIGWIITAVLTGLTLMLAVRSSGLRKRLRRIVDLVVGFAVIVAIVVSLADLINQDAIVVSSARPSWILILIAAASPIFVTRRIFKHRTVTRQTLFGALAVYLLIALVFDYLFLSLHGVAGLSFFATDEPTTTYMYFSLVTLTTLGYGDFAPAHEFGRFLATTEALIGQVFLVTVVARLVSMFGVGRSPKFTNRESSSTDAPP